MIVSTQRIDHVRPPKTPVTDISVVSLSGLARSVSSISTGEIHVPEISPVAPRTIKDSHRTELVLGTFVEHAMNGFHGDRYCLPRAMSSGGEEYREFG